MDSAVRIPLYLMRVWDFPLFSGIILKGDSAIQVQMPDIKLEIVSGVVLAFLIAGLAFLGAGRIFKELKGIGNGLVAIGIILGVIAVFVVLYIAWRKG